MKDDFDEFQTRLDNVSNEVAETKKRIEDLKVRHEAFKKEMKIRAAQIATAKDSYFKSL